MLSVTVAIEGASDEGVARSLLREAGVGHHIFTGRSGKSALLKRLKSYNAAAQHMPWLVLVDLDGDFPCAPAAVEAWLNGEELGAHMCLRVAVTEMEAWLLADAEAISRFLGVSRSLIPLDPDNLQDPKGSLIGLARRSTKRAVREGLVPRDGSGASVGPTYVSDINVFATELWRPQVARAASPSLDRALKALDRLVSS